MIRRVVCCRGRVKDEEEVKKEAEIEIVEDAPTNTGKAVIGDEVDQSENILEAGLVEEKSLTPVQVGEAEELEEVEKSDVTEELGKHEDFTKTNNEAEKINVIEEIITIVNDDTGAGSDLISESPLPPSYNEIASQIEENYPKPSAPPITYSLQDKLRQELGQDENTSDKLIIPRNLNEEELNEKLMNELDGLY